MNTRRDKIIDYVHVCVGQQHTNINVAATAAAVVAAAVRHM